MAQTEIYGLIEDLANPDSDVQAKAEATIMQLGEEAVEPLIAALTDNINFIRQRAAEMLGALRAKRAIKPLSACLRDEEASVRISAVEALSKIGGEEVIAPLLKALADKDSKVCSSAAGALSEIGHDVLSPLIKSLNDESPSVRVFAAETLSKIGSQKAVLPLAKALATDMDSQAKKQALDALRRLKSTEVVDILLAALLDADEQMRETAAIAIRGIAPKEAVNRLAEGLKSASPQERIQSIKALGALGREGIELLIAALNDADADVQCAAIEALGNIRIIRCLDVLLPLCSLRSPTPTAYGDTRDNRLRETALASALATIQMFDISDILKRLAERLDDEYEPVDVRRGAIKILAQLVEKSPCLSSLRKGGQEGFQRGKATDLLLTALDDEDQQVRISAIDVLGEIKLAEAVEPIIAAMKDKNEWVRWHCAAALGKIGSEEAVPRLIIALLEDRSWWVRYHAAEALGEIGDAKAIKPLLSVIQNKDEDERVKSKAQEAARKIRGN